VSTPAEHGGAAPPPEKPPETPAEAIPPSEAEGTAEVLDAPETPATTPARGSGPSTRTIDPPRALPARRGVQLVTRPEPSWRELGWWLSLAESGQETAQARGGRAALRLYYVTQLGLPLWAASHLSVINGRLVVSSELLRAIAARAGYDVAPEDWTDDSCTAYVVRRADGEVIGRYTFTIADAQRAELIRPRSAWVTHPRRMLWARAAAFALRDAIPEVVLGFQTTDEQAEIYGREAEPIGVDAPYEYGPAERDEDIPFRWRDPWLTGEVNVDGAADHLRLR